MNWYVLYTRPRAERKTAEELEKLGFEIFCPLTTELRQWSDRKKLVKTPLFKSYIFIKTEESKRNEAFQVPSVVRYLMWLGKPALVRAEEIEIIKSWLDDEKFEEVKVYSLNPGERVRIHNGVLSGQIGIVKEVGNREVKMVLESLNMVVTTKLRNVL